MNWSQREFEKQQALSMQTQDMWRSEELTQNTQLQNSSESSLRSPELKDESASNNGNSEKVQGGEITNSTGTYFVISGGTNSNEKDFHWLGPGTNSDDDKWVQTQLGGDVDALWPGGRRIKNGDTGEIVTDGVFKISDLRNANIDQEGNDYVITDFSTYFPENAKPPGWNLPGKFKIN